MKPKPRITPEQFAQAKQETTPPAKEALEHLYKALLAIPPFTLKDGRLVRVEGYIAPTINEEGEAECGVDIKLSDGHLEFMLKNTGWGRSFADILSQKREQPAPKRQR